MSEYTKEIAIIAVVILEGIALAKGFDGAGLASALAVIGGLAGYSIGKKREK